MREKHTLISTMTNSMVEVLVGFLILFLVALAPATLHALSQMGQGHHVHRVVRVHSPHPVVTSRVG